MHVHNDNIPVSNDSNNKTKNIHESAIDAANRSNKLMIRHDLETPNP